MVKSYICLALLIFSFSPIFSQPKKTVGYFKEIINYGEDDGLAERIVNGFVIDNKGLGWVGGPNGLYLFTGTHFYHASQFIPQCAEITDRLIGEMFYDSPGNNLIVFTEFNDTTKIISFPLSFNSGAVQKRPYIKELGSFPGKLKQWAVFRNRELSFICGNTVYLGLSVTEDTPPSEIIKNTNAEIIQYNYRTNTFEIWLGANPLNTTVTVVNNKQNQKRNVIFVNPSEGLNYFAKLHIESQIRIIKNIPEFYNYENIELALIKNSLEKEFTSSRGIVIDPYLNIYIFGELGIQRILRNTDFISSIVMPTETRRLWFNEKTDEGFVATSSGIRTFSIKNYSEGKEILGDGSVYYMDGFAVTDSVFCFLPLEYQRPALLLNTFTRKFKYIKHPILHNVRCVEVQEPGKRIYVGCDKALYRLTIKDGLLTGEKVVEPFYYNVGSLLHFSDTALLAGSGKALFMINPKTKTIKKILSEDVLALAKCGDYLAAGTRYNGMILLDKKFIAVKAKANSVQSGTVFSLFFDGDYQNLWIGTSTGLVIWHLPSNMNFKFTTKDGLADNEFNRNSVLVSKSKNLLIMGGIRGLNIIRYRNFQNDYLLFDNSVIWGLTTEYMNGKIENQYLGEAENLQVSLSENVNKLTFKTIDATANPLSIVITYKMDDDEWKSLSGRNDIEILLPKSGEHVLSMRSSAIGSDEYKEYKLNFYIQKKWHETVAGISLILLLIALALYSIWYFRGRYLKLQYEARLNATKEELIGIIAHDLKSPINDYQDLAETVRFMIDTNDYSGLDEIGQEINERSIQLDYLLDSLLNWSFIAQGKLKPHIEMINFKTTCENVYQLYIAISQNRGKAISFSYTGTDVVYSDENLLSLILRNMIDNAVKYSELGSEISLNVTAGENGLDVIVSNIAESSIKDNLLATKVPKHESSKRNLKQGLGMRFVERAVLLLNGTSNFEYNDISGIVKWKIFVPLKKK